MNKPVSIIIPTRNRAAVLKMCLAALPGGARGLEAPEVLVVDDCSADATPEVVGQFRQQSGWSVHHLRQERPLGANAARNVALRAARGEVIVLIDDDVIVSDGWLSKLLSGLSEQCPVVSGAVRLTLEGPVLGKHREEIQALLGEILHAPQGFGGETVPVLGNLAAYRWVFDRAGFDDTVRPPVEEADWLLRTGVRAGFVPDAWVWHHKTREELKLGRVLSGMWRRGGEGGWWIRDRLKLSFSRRLSLALRSLQTSCRAFAHAVCQRCWGGVIVGLGELSRALALAGLIHHGTRAPQSWR